MTTNKHDYLKRLLQIALPGTVLLSKYLEEIGISRDLQQYYKRSGWLKTIGSGAFLLVQDQPEWTGAIYAIQHHSTTIVHPGALTALSLQGMSHYIRLGAEKLYLFLESKRKLPKWFKGHDWGQLVESYPTNFLPAKTALIKYECKNVTINISSAERAILECLYLSPGKMDLVECYHIMEGLTNLRPAICQELLENCHSVKVKRLFFYLAEKTGHAWFKYLDQTKIDLGSGDRALVKNGVYISHYKITVTEELARL